MHSHIRLRDGFFNPDMLHDGGMIDEVRVLLRLCLNTVNAQFDPFLRLAGDARTSGDAHGKPRPVHLG